VKLAFVVQRYGAEIAGGSETHCRELARRLSSHHEITILTTCARDYITWRNAYPPGESIHDGVRVVRFRVARPRNLDRFAELSDQAFDGGAPRQLQEAWFRANGPDAPALLEHLARHGRDYDLVLFWTFRYAPSYFGVPLVRERAVLVPTAEEDPAMSLDVLETFFRQPAGFLFMTPEEQALVSARAGRDLVPAAIVGIGIDPAVQQPSGAEILRRHGIDSDYVLYLGRVDRNKGCDTLLEYFQAYAAARDAATLVLAGPQAMQVPPHPRIRATGYVSDELREALLAHARLLVVPSRYESLSIVLLEAWNHGVPALVNARCRVLQGQVRRANGGLYYRSATEFAEALDWLLTRPDLRDVLGRQGRAYVDREYRWPTVIERVERLLEEVAGQAGRF
jgi:glycosyltransferase involved in cell wall biosynthesis